MIESVPVGNVVRLISATPLYTVPVPIDELPLRKVTVPLVTAVPLLVTVAVNITLSPGDGLVEDELNVVAVPTWGIVTVTNTVLDAEAARLDVPRKLAVIEFAPVGSVVRFNVATPLITAPVPMREPSFRNVTTPLVAGLPPLLTVAVKTTLAP